MADSSSEGGFPQFDDGDVIVVVSTSKIYKLHSHVLQRVSGYFRNVFGATQVVKLTAAARREGFTAWRFVLLEDPSLPNNSGGFVSLPVTESGRVIRNVAPRGPRTTIAGEDEDKCWDWLFGCFYGINPSFDSSTFGATVNGCFELLDVADTVDANIHVREVVDLALMRQDDVLWKSIAQNPTVWAELGRRIKSPAIFREAVIHIVGKWKTLDLETKDSLPTDIYKLCQRKWDELEVAKRAIEIRIAGHYPPFLCRNHADKPHRTAYASDIYMWMSLSYFRQYISQSGNDAKNRQAQDGGYEWYKQLSQGGDTYLDHNHMRRFFQFFPMSAKACGVMEANMNVLKEDIKLFVKDLMIVRTHIDPAKIEQGGQPWLTCTVVETADLPWNVPDENGDQRMAEHAEDTVILANKEDDD